MNGRHAELRLSHETAGPPGDLARLLTLVHGAPGQLVTLEAVVRDWRNYDGPRSVVASPRTGAPSLRWAPPDVDAQQERVRRILYAAPHDLRVEVYVAAAAIAIAVRNGATWRLWSHERGFTSGTLVGAGATQLPVLLNPPLLNPASLLAALSFRPTGSGSRAGREVVVASATARESWHGASDLEVQCEFDARFGFLVRRETRREGRSLDVTEAIEVKCDSGIDPNVFKWDGAAATDPESTS